VTEKGKFPDRWDIVLVVAFALAALLLFGWRIQVPPEYVYDEVYHAYTAGEFARGNKEAYEWWTTAPREGVAYGWVQPPLGKLLMAAGILLFGNNSFGWRIASLLFGSAIVPLVYLFGRTVLRDRLVASLAGFLLLFEGLLFVQSRVAMLDTFVTLFLVAAYGLMYFFLESPAEKSASRLLPIGVLLGLGIATKWNAFYALGIAGLLVVYKIYVLNSNRRLAREVRQGLVGNHLSMGFLSLIVVPAVIYLLSYVQFFALGHNIAQFIELQRQMWIYNTRLEATHAYASRWWTWPLMIRPVWYYVSHTGDKVAHIYARGNPIVWWAFLPSVAVVCWNWWWIRSKALGIVLLAFFGQWLPWMLSPRITFFQHMLTSVPFACLAIAYVLASFWRKDRLWLAISVAYLALVVAGFVYFYPLMAAWPISQARVDARMWFPSWR